MLKAIQKYFDLHITIESEVEVSHQLKLATTALLIEMMLQDNHIDQNEIIAIKESIRSSFNLSQQQSQSLYEIAEQEQRNATDYHQFTRLIAKNYSNEQKLQVIENLWKVAYSDGKLDSLEEHMLRRISDLIYVAHSDFIRIKLKVLESLK
ncbi:hypothetical protein MNBD_GAMMA22-2387 [hydrothermal vent metagenome]|uniref:Co-chaperone DjlA N-terminal domain-containing protein n=1 Tax=hydrothermal vent metagenome TaxID=652676 RepID=A0A3B0ZVP4_9ZZZZ